jgi:hypothetical protein
MITMQDILAQYDKEQRNEIEFHGVRREELPCLVRFVGDSPGMSFILYSQLDENDVEGVIQEPDPQTSIPAP